MTKENKKYIIWAYPYRSNSGGIIVLHKLCHMLNELGEQAYLWPGEGSFDDLPTCDKYNTPIAKPEFVEDSIVIYPEIVNGNPINAKHVVRWILNTPGFISGDGIYDKNDFILYFSKAFTGGKRTTGNFLQLFEMNNVIYQDYKHERSGSCFVRRRGRNRELIHNIAESVEITNTTPSQDLVDLFNSKKYFFSYDDATFLSLQAAMCGCISVVIPNANVTPEEWKSLSPTRKYGVAYGFEDIDHAINTKDKVKEHLESLNDISVLMLQEFIEKTQNRFNDEFEKGNHRDNSESIIRRAKIELNYDNLFEAEQLINNSNDDKNVDLIKLNKEIEGKRNQMIQEKKWNNIVSNELLNQCETLIENKQLEVAIKKLFDILNIEPRNIDALNDLAVVYVLQNNFIDARSIIDIVLKLDEQNEIALGNLEYILQTEIAKANENIQANEQAKTPPSQIHSSSSEELIKKYNLNSNYQSSIGGGDFVKVGEDLLQQMIKACNLSPDEKVLDVGSGYGRLALPLSKYLSENGEYRGMEIVKNEVDWCTDVITSQRNNFRFIHADVYNFHYNRGGSTRACFYKFPFESNYFDFILLTSVFTHMLSFELDNYLSEIARVLRPGGRSFITYFLMNEESKRLMKEKQSAMYFPTKIGEFWLKDVNDPEAAVCFDESFILDLYRRHGLKVETPLKYGQWSGRKSFFDYQDVIIAKK